MAKKIISRENIPGLLMSGLGLVLLVSRITRQSRRMSFQGASIIVTGGSRGLGLEISRVFAREGARLTLLARDREELDRARRELIALGGYVVTRECNIADQREVREAVASVIRERGRIDVLVNNAGIIQVGPFENTDERDFEELLDVYVRGPLFLIKSVAGRMKRQGGGRIVNISSIGGLVAIPHLVAYSVGKSGETGLSDGVRAEFAKDNIRVTTVIPGLLKTGSYVNALYKGQHGREFVWFALSAALPLLSTDPRRAARSIVDACRYGDPYLIISFQARVLKLMNALFPRMTASLMKLGARLLPAPAGRHGNAGKTGWESRSVLSLSVTERLSSDAIERNNEGKENTVEAVGQELKAS